jgi:hypothetical protein
MSPCLITSDSWIVNPHFAIPQLAQVRHLRGIFKIFRGI